MSILGSVLKVTGTIVEGCGKTIRDCVEVVEQETREYRESEQYIKDKEERDRLKAEVADNWKRLKNSTKELVKEYRTKETK